MRGEGIVRDLVVVGRRSLGGVVEVLEVASVPRAHVDLLSLVLDDERVEEKLLVLRSILVVLH